MKSQVSRQSGLNIYDPNFVEMYDLTPFRSSRLPRKVNVELIETSMTRHTTPRKTHRMCRRPYFQQVWTQQHTKRTLNIVQYVKVQRPEPLFPSRSRVYSVQSSLPLFNVCNQTFQRYLYTSKISVTEGQLTIFYWFHLNKNKCCIH